LSWEDVRVGNLFQLIGRDIYRLIKKIITNSKPLNVSLIGICLVWYMVEWLVVTACCLALCVAAKRHL
jgi:hypothetical protein